MPSGSGMSQENRDSISVEQTEASRTATYDKHKAFRSATSHRKPSEYLAGGFGVRGRRFAVCHLP